MNDYTECLVHFSKFSVLSILISESFLQKLLANYTHVVHKTCRFGLLKNLLIWTDVTFEQTLKITIKTYPSELRKLKFSKKLLFRCKDVHIHKGFRGQILRHVANSIKLVNYRKVILLFPQFENILNKSEKVFKTLKAFFFGGFNESSRRNRKKDAFGDGFTKELTNISRVFQGLVDFFDFSSALIDVEVDLFLNSLSNVVSGFVYQNQYIEVVFPQFNSLIQSVKLVKSLGSLLLFLELLNKQTNSSVL